MERNPYDHIHLDMEELFVSIYDKCKEYSMNGPIKMYSLFKAIEYVHRNNISGDVVECGVYKGGSAMLCALYLKHMNDIERKIYLYDTFEGMSQPRDNDVSWTEKEKAIDIWPVHNKGDYNSWCYCPLDKVKENFHKTLYPIKKAVFVKGKVENTIPRTIPDKISLLRLDTDFYESTLHELEHLYPRLQKNGVLIIDDFGSWKGSYEAVNEYFCKHNINMLLHKVDYGCRIGIKI